MVESHKSSVLADLLAASQDPYSWLAAYKKRHSTRIIGLFPMYLPAELIHAAGMLPVVLWRGDAPVTVGQSLVPAFSCGIVRTLVDDLLRGKLDVLDGMLFYDMCLQARGLPFIIEKTGRVPDFLHAIYYNSTMPEPFRAVQKSYLLENLERLKASLEEFGGITITDARLAASIAVFNRNRQLLRMLYGLRRDKPALLGARDMMAIAQAGMLMPKEEHNGLIEALLPELEKEETRSNGRVRLVAVGGLCQTIPAEVLDLVEETGVVLVDDDLYVGARFSANDAEPAASPLESLANRYLTRMPTCPTKPDWETSPGASTLALVRETRAQGVLTFMIKNCPPQMECYPETKAALTAAGIPELTIEVDHEAVPLGQIRTRIQTFVEMIRD